MTEATRNKILLIDDNSLFLNILVQAFAKTGIICITAGSAKEAINLLQTNRPDIILSDYEMPGMNGIELRKYLMQNKILKDIPFVFLTSLTDKDLLLQGLDLEAIDYIIKDTPVNVIISKLSNILLAVNKQRELSTAEVTNAAKSLNVKSIPAKTPVVNGFGIDFWHRPYHDIPGGDFIDFIPVNERYTFIALGDVMGKKWMAWYFTFGFLSYIRSAVRFATFNADYSTASILSKVNHIICLDDILQDILSSLSLLLIDTEKQVITYSGAGDLPLLHYDAKTAELRQVQSSGLLLGLFAEGEYTEQEIKLAPNDQLFIFTDGMIDFAGNKGKKSDYNLFASTITNQLNTNVNFEQMKATLFDTLADAQVDDCSIINIYKN
ncbi:hypothetical protein GCM10023149_12830 [Mucilaginibacter gynuensis]|uniref:Response regulatory domain-containing protein n=1 Tax=Mucilaginibacter gynuensis TaxID=1302236 RepID=A0ABP8G2N6_9SPHI